MKKFGQFLLSLILPRKMARFRNMHFLLALCIYILGTFLALGSQFIMSKHFTKKDMDRIDYVNTLGNGKFIKMQKITISSESNVAVDDSNIDSEVYTVVMQDTTQSRKLKATVAFDVEFNIIDTDTLEYNDKLNVENLVKDYYRSVRNEKEEGHDFDTIFYLFTKKGIYYSYNINTEGNINISEQTDLSFLTNPDLFQYRSYKQYTNDLKRALATIQTIEETSVVALQNKIRANLPNFFNKMSEYLSETPQYDDYVVEEMDFSFYGYTFHDNACELYTNSYFMNRGIYHTIVPDANDKYLDVTVVLDPNYNIRSDKEEDHKLSYFDYEGYFKQEKRENTTYVLCLFANDRMFYVYDLAKIKTNDGYTYLDYSSGSIFEMTNDGNRKYYLPNSADELVYNAYGALDTRYWTKEVSKDDQFELTNDFGDTSHLSSKDLENIEPVNRHRDTFANAIYTRHSRSYLYADMVGNDFRFNSVGGELKLFLQNVVDEMIIIDSANYELVYAIMAIGVFVIFPLVMVLIVWLMSKKLVMKRVRQYYAIGAITYSLSGVIAFLLGFFFSFDQFALYFMFFQAWLYIFVTLRINTDPKYDDHSEDDIHTPSQKESQKVEFKNIKDVKKEKTSQIG